MQAKAHPPKESSPFNKPFTLFCGEHVHFYQPTNVSGAEVAVTNPKRSVDVAHAAGRGFYVGF